MKKFASWIGRTIVAIVFGILAGIWKFFKSLIVATVEKIDDVREAREDKKRKAFDDGMQKALSQKSFGHTGDLERAIRMFDREDE